MPDTTLYREYLADWGEFERVFVSDSVPTGPPTDTPTPEPSQAVPDSPPGWRTETGRIGSPVRYISFDYEAVERLALEHLHLPEHWTAATRINFESNPWTTWDQVRNRNRTTFHRTGEPVYDITVATNQAEDTTRVYNTDTGNLMVAIDGPYKDHVLLNIGTNRFIDLTQMRGMTEDVGNYSFYVRRLSSSDAVTMIVR